MMYWRGELFYEHFNDDIILSLFLLRDEFFKLLIWIISFYCIKQKTKNLKNSLIVVENVS